MQLSKNNTHCGMHEQDKGGDYLRAETLSRLSEMLAKIQGNRGKINTKPKKRNQKMENFNVKSKTEFNLRTGEKKQIIEALVITHGIPKIFTIGEYSERNGKVSVMKSNPETS